MIKTFIAMEQNPNRATGQATDDANTWLDGLNQQRATQLKVDYKWKHFVTTMTVVTAVEDNPWFVFTITATYGI